MEQKRFISFIVLSMAILVGWNAFFIPWWNKRNGNVPNRPVAEKGKDEQPADDGKKPGEEKGDEKPVDGKDSGAEKPAAEVAAAEKPEGEQALAEKPEEGDAEEKPAAKPAEVAKFPDRNVVLGSLDPKSEFRQAVTLSSRGSAVETIELNDPRYKTLTKPHVPLAVVGTDGTFPWTLAFDVPQAGVDLVRRNWEVIDVQPAEAPHTEATFRITAGELEITRKYVLGKVDTQASRPEAPAYELTSEMTIRNLSSKSRVVNYELQGPTGLPLENVDNTQKFRDVVAGFVNGPGSVRHELMAGKTIADGKVEEWQKAFDYLGVDVQYFVSLLMPGVDQREKPYTKSVKQELIGPNLKEKSEVSVLLTSVDLDLDAAGAKDGADSVTHTYRLFAGPKRDDVLPTGSEKVVDFGMFHWISRPMLALLKAFHALFGSWGFAVICLTIVVRSALFPLSIKQARGAAKMQELQPELAALKEKYGKDKEKMARAQMELFSKHNYNPLAGCLPIFLQLPIFMGLYQALNHAVDLRSAKFLWINNLAAPDALFPLPFIVPYFGWKEFNLLPLITLSLFMLQQKMFMPPPANEEQAMQQKMMNFMMIFMGVMFYKVPAGLCVYFIASSLWGMAERKLLPKAKPPEGNVTLIDNRRSPEGGNGKGGNGKGRGGDDDDNKPEGGGFFSMLLKAAEKETAARRSSGTKRR